MADFTPVPDPHIISDQAVKAIEDGKKVLVEEIGYVGTFYGHEGRPMIAIALEPGNWAHMLMMMEWMHQMQHCESCQINAEGISSLLQRNGWHVIAEKNEEGKYRIVIERCPDA